MRRLEKLEKIAKEKEDLKEDLKEKLTNTIGRFANLIANYCDEGTKIHLDNRTLWVKTVPTKFGDEKFLVTYSDVPRVITNFTPGSTTYLYGDYNSKLYIADIETFCWVAEHAQQIIEGFITEMKKKNSNIKSSIEKFKRTLKETIDQIE